MYATREEIRRAAGRMIMCGFSGKTVTPEVRELMREIHPLGLILFSRNVESPEQVAELNAELKSLRPRDSLLIAVDQEGGRVQRVRAPATEWQPMRALGRIDDIALTEKVGAAIARELRSMNFDVDLAPVLDVNTNPKNPVIGDRAFGTTPEVVARHGVALIKGLQQTGIGACGKHFPGHGDTELDSHHALPVVDHDPDRLEHIEWPPFKAAIKAGVGAIMTAHVVVRSLDEQLPATLSPHALQPLRDDLGFDGVILSDDLEMKAVADRFTPEQMAVSGVRAGVDVMLACHDPDVILRLYRALVVAGEHGELTHEALLAAESRAKRWRDRYAAKAVSRQETKRWVGAAEHAVLRQIIEERLHLVS